MQNFNLGTLPTALWVITPGDQVAENPDDDTQVSHDLWDHAAVWSGLSGSFLTATPGRRPRAAFRFSY